MADRPLQFRTIPWIHSPTVLERVSPDRLRAMEATQARSVSAWVGIVREAVSAGDLELPRGLKPEVLTFSLYALLFGSFMLAELHRPGGLVGITDPTDAIRAHLTATLDGLGWRPTSNEVDTSDVVRRIRKTLFGEGGRRAR